jgi:hypothetical protein
MAAPVPPAGNQSPHTERPLRVYAEQYLSGQPLPIGVVINPTSALGPDGGGFPIYQDGLPRVALPLGWVVVHETDWVISSRYSGKVSEVISADEFAERFGPGGGPTEEGT